MSALHAPERPLSIKRLYNVCNANDFEECESLLHLDGHFKSVALKHIEQSKL